MKTKATFLSNDAILSAIAGAGISLDTLEGRKAGRELINKLTGAKWVKSRMIGDSLWIVETSNGNVGREIFLGR